MMQSDNFASVSISALIAAQSWQEKYRMITQWGTLISFKENIRTDENLIRGCETLAWISHHREGDRHRILFDSESRVINGLAAILLSLVDNQTSIIIKTIKLSALLQEAGLEKHMTPSRHNGFKTIAERIYAFVENESS